MHCTAWNNLFLRANGEFNCYCGVGENYTIYKDTPISSAPVNIVDNVINGAYVGIRQKLKDNLIPFPDTCPKCCFFSEKKFSGSIYTDVIDTFQVETSFKCNMNCSACIPKNVRGKFPGPDNLSLSYFKKVVENLHERNIKVRRVDFWGKGEPFMNHKISNMVKLVKKQLNAVTSVSTNGNVTWNDDFVLCGLDQIVFSIDGAFPSSYKKYRDGDWNLAIKNLKQARKLASPKQQIIWKYILFSHNDSNEELLTAKKIAAEIDVNLQFVFTVAPNPSLRFYNKNDLEKFWQAPENYPPSPLFQPLLEKSLIKLRKYQKNGIYIFGAAGIGIEVKKFLEHNNIPISGWIDSAAYKHNMKLDGIKVYSPDDIKDLNISAIVIGSKSSIPEIKKQIQKNSIPLFEINGIA